MKKLTALFLALCLASSPVLASETASDASADYDLLFEQGEASLAEAKDVPALTGITIANDITMTDYLRENFGDSETDVKRALIGCLADASVAGISPSGRSALFFSMENRASVAVYDGEARLIFPSETRGVEDTNGKLETYFNRGGPGTVIGEEGLVWSHDGRYCVVLNNYLTIMMLNLMLDPIVIDLATGEAFLTATYGMKPMNENAGAVVTAAFSEDDRYLYYTLYGSVGGARYAFCRYDFGTETTEVLFSTDMLMFDYPHLCQVGEDSFLLLNDVRKPEESTGLVSVHETGGKWSVSPRFFRETSVEWYPRRMVYSAASDHVMVTGLIARTLTALRVFRPEDDADGFNTTLLLSADDLSGDLSVASLGSAEVKALLEALRSPEEASVPYLNLMGAAFSPDGEVILAAYYAPGDADGSTPGIRFCLIRLSDLACIPVSLPESLGEIQYISNTSPLIEWNAGTVLIHTDRLSTKALTLQSSQELRK